MGKSLSRKLICAGKVGEEEEEEEKRVSVLRKCYKIKGESPSIVVPLDTITGEFVSIPPSKRLLHKLCLDKQSYVMLIEQLNAETTLQMLKINKLIVYGEVKIAGENPLTEEYEKFVRIVDKILFSFNESIFYHKSCRVVNFTHNLCNHQHYNQCEKIYAEYLSVRSPSIIITSIKQLNDDDNDDRQIEALLSPSPLALPLPQ